MVCHVQGQHELGVRSLFVHFSPTARMRTAAVPAAVESPQRVDELLREQMPATRVHRGNRSGPNSGI